MRKILATVFGLAVLATATPALAANTSNPHPGWQHNPHNPHYRPPITSCLWVQTATIGSAPHCVKVVTPVFHPTFPGADPVPTPVYKPPFGTPTFGAAIGDVPPCV